MSGWTIALYAGLLFVGSVLVLGFTSHWPSAMGVWLQGAVLGGILWRLARIDGALAREWIGVGLVMFAAALVTASQFLMWWILRRVGDL